MDVSSLPEHVLGLVFTHLASPADRMSVLLVCKRFLSAAVAHSPALWESLKVSDNKGDRQGSFWLAHHRHVRSLHVATTAMGGGPGVFLQLAMGLAGLPLLERLRVEAPAGRNPGIMQVWMKQAFQAINALSTLRHLQLEGKESHWEKVPGRRIYWSPCTRQVLPLLLEPGALPSLQSLELLFHRCICKVEVPPGALRSLASLTQLRIDAVLTRSSSSGPGNTSQCTLGWADLEGTTALRQLHWDVWTGGRLSLSESEALNLLGRLEQLSVTPAEGFSKGIWAALPQLAALTRVGLVYDGEQVWEGTADSAPILAVAACHRLKELYTNWLPPVQLPPCQLSTLTRLVLRCDEYQANVEPEGSWFAAMPALAALEVYGRRLPFGVAALPSLKSLHFSHRRGEGGDGLESLSALPNLTCLELEGHREWRLPPGPYLSNLRSLALMWADAKEPIPPALADARCLASLKLFTCEFRQQHKRYQGQVYSCSWEAPVPPDSWAPDDVALLRALPALERVELVEYKVLSDWGKAERAELPPEWQRSAGALAAQLPGVSVVGRKCTWEETEFKFTLSRFSGSA